MNDCERQWCALLELHKVEHSIRYNKMYHILYGTSWIPLSFSVVHISVTCCTQTRLYTPSQSHIKIETKYILFIIIFSCNNEHRADK